MALAERQAEFAGLAGEPKDIQQLIDHRERVEPLPTKTELDELLNAAFFASLTEEEGHSVSFSLLYFNPAMATESNWPRLHFASPIQLSVECIRKLSPAAPHQSTDIAVFRMNGALWVWGLVYLRTRKGMQRSYPPGLTIGSAQSGILTVRMTDRLLVTYSRGHATFYGEHTLVDRLDLSQFVSHVFDSSSYSERLRLASILIGLATVPLEEGSGATLLILPSNHKVIGLDEPRYKATPDSSSILFESLVTGKGLSDVAEGVARLAFIDGATVFQEGRGLLGAGAMVQTKSVEDFEVRLISPHDVKASPLRTTYLAFNGGARHRSALVFCHLNPGAIAIVVSQDGVMSLLVRPTDETAVYALRPIHRGIQLA
jgi:hypothetical protein